MKYTVIELEPLINGSSNNQLHSETHPVDPDNKMIGQMTFPHSGKCRSHVEHGEDAKYCTGAPCTMRFTPPATDEARPKDPAVDPDNEMVTHQTENTIAWVHDVPHRGEYYFITW